MNITHLLPKPKAKTLKQRVVKAVAMSIASTGIIGASLFVSQANSVVDAMPAPSDQGVTADVMNGRTPAKGSPSAVWAKHKATCWDASMEPKAEWPGHAIVQFNDGRTVYTANAEMVDAAFNEALAAIGYADHRKSLPFDNVIGLCK